MVIARLLFVATAATMGFGEYFVTGNNIRSYSITSPDGIQRDSL
jgi:hypothetical protein